jgi:NAD(P)-dependent dehydrogenase (short-subunit alcohol dehydrogenase family)
MTFMTKTIVITGANRGIGLAMTKELNEQGHNVYALCRNSSDALNALSVHVVTEIDVATEQGIKAMTKALSGIGIDVLICNAGILRDESLSDLNLDTIREQFEVNAVAPLVVVDALQCNLNPDGKVAMITSRMGSIADNGSGGRYGYRMSKAALNAASMSLSKDLYEQDVAVGIYHPGYVQTEMVNNNGDISASEAAKRIVGLINNLTMKETGVFKHSNGEVLPW